MESQEENHQHLQFQCQKLTDKTTIESLRAFTDLLAKTMGPHGSIKILANSCGGHLSLTTLSNRLLSTMTPACPLIKLILTAADQHVRRYGDAGIFMTRLTLNLILNGLRSEISRKLLARSNLVFFRVLSDYLQSPEFPCKAILEISNVKSWVCVASTMLSSKPLCELDSEEISLIAQLLLKAFVTKLPPDEASQGETSDIHIVGVTGQSSAQSFCCHGILLETNNLAEAKDWIQKRDPKKGSAIKAIMLDISMAGDSEELLEVTFEGLTLESLEESFLSFIEDFCRQFTDSEISIVFCQKVIHPRIKELLRGMNILPIDRLGSEQFPKVLNITGSYPVSSFSEPLVANQVGTIDHLSIMNIGKKSFLHVSQTTTSITTLVLTAFMDEQLEELKALSNNILLVFEHLLRNPSILFGGGCWQFCITKYLRLKVNTEKELLSEELKCSHYQLLEVCEYFCRCLEQSSLPQASSGLKCYTHPTIGHLWITDQHLASHNPNPTSCVCGTTKFQVSELSPLPEEYFSSGLGIMVNNSKNANEPKNSFLAKEPLEEPLLMDCLTSWKNSLETSVKMAEMALCTNQFIYESVQNR